MSHTRFTLIALLGFLAGCVFPADFWCLDQLIPPASVGDAAQDLAPDGGDPGAPQPAPPSFDPIRVRISNPTWRDADVNLTMFVSGAGASAGDQEVHFTFRRIVAAMESLIIGPERADLIRIDVTFLGTPPTRLETQVLRINQDFFEGTIIEVVLEAPLPLVAIERLDDDVTVTVGDTLTFDVVTENAPATGRIATFADPDANPASGNEINVSDDAPAAARTSVTFDTAEIPPGTYRIYAVLTYGDVALRSAPAPGAITVVGIPVGACCFSDGSCELTTAEECAASGGEYQGDDTSCDPSPCVQPAGACCLPDGSCLFITEEECFSLEGEYQGDDTSCDPNPCPQPLGACCFPDGSCSVLTEAECSLAGGEYMGDDTSCDPDNPCPQPEGACCFSDGFCYVLTEADCLSSQGEYLGDGTSCDPNPCPQPMGACCFTDGSCLVLAEDECLSLEGEYQGDGITCDPNPCRDPFTCPDLSMFSQLPDFLADPNDPNGLTAFAHLSEYDPFLFGATRFENFSGVQNDICGISWWGFMAIDLGDGIFVPCSPPELFEIEFYYPGDGFPGETAWEATPVLPTVEGTGLYFGGMGELMRFTIDRLDPCCTLSDGWVRIVGLGDPDCKFFWMGSVDGDHFSWVEEYGEPFSEPFDLSVCLLGQ